MNLVNAVGIMLSFGGVAVLTLWLVHKQMKYMRKREKEVMSTISAIQYSQLKGVNHGDNNRHDGRRVDVSKSISVPDSREHDNNRTNKCD